MVGEKKIQTVSNACDIHWYNGYDYCPFVLLEVRTNHKFNLSSNSKCCHFKSVFYLYSSFSVMWCEFTQKYIECQLLETYLLFKNTTLMIQSKTKLQIHFLSILLEYVKDIFPIFYYCKLKLSELYRKIRRKLYDNLKVADHWFYCWYFFRIGK